MEALGEDEKQLAQLIEEEKKSLNELREEVIKANEQKRKKQEEFNQVCKEFADAYGIALSPGEHYRAVALDGTQFQPTGVISGGDSSDLKEKAKKWDGNIIRKMWDRLNLLHEELRNLHYTNAKRELDVEMISNKIVQLEFRLKFVQQQEKEEIITNTVQQQQEQQKQQKIVEKVKQAVLPATVMTRNQQIPQQIVAAAAAANRSLGYAGISAAAAAAKLITGIAAKRQKQQMGTTTSSAISSRGNPAKMISASEKRPYPQEQEQSSSNKLPTSSTICQPPPEKNKKRIDEEAIDILAKEQGLKKLDSFLKMFFEQHNYEYIHEDFVQALYQFSIKQRKQIVQTSAGSEHRNNE